LKIILITVGSIKTPYVKQGVFEYVKRLERYASFEAKAVKEEPYKPPWPKDGVLRKEAVSIRKSLAKGDFVVALSDGGKEFSSKEFSGFIGKVFSGGKKRIVFVIGGAYGLDRDLVEEADLTLSLSRMTLPHELCALLFVEQLYRAFTIIKGEPYSH